MENDTTPCSSANFRISWFALLVMLVLGSNHFILSNRNSFNTIMATSTTEAKASAGTCYLSFHMITIHFHNIIPYHTYVMCSYMFACTTNQNIPVLHVCLTFCVVPRSNSCYHRHRYTCTSRCCSCITWCRSYYNRS